MQRTVDLHQTIALTDDAITEALAEGDHIIVERDGEPLAAVIPFALYAAWLRRREEFFDDLRGTANRVDMDEEEAMAFALEAIRQDRAERRRTS